MAKGIKLSEFQKSDITPLKKFSNSHREISKSLGCSKTAICNYLKIPIKCGIWKPTGRPEKLSPKFKRTVRELKKKKIVNIKNHEIARRCSLQY